MGSACSGSVFLGEKFIKDQTPTYEMVEREIFSLLNVQHMGMARWCPCSYCKTEDSIWGSQMMVAADRGDLRKNLNS